ncbi:major facilitator superfamily domain-containing protein [Aspergillus stella-maris]|uniref:major facilitator superfamily domain-containing protein n=1 Tax=Aspergillus stella-maris TaxID=1810926 RepID=UPI003CCD1FE0
MSYSTLFLPRGYTWRSSSAFIIFTAVLALFTEGLLYSIIVPILSYMIEVRLGLPSSQTPWYTSALLATHGFFSMLSAPVIGHFADRTPDRKTPLLFCLVGCAGGTGLVAFTPSVAALFLGRILQAVSGSAAWIVAFATIADNVAPERLGQTLGLASSFVSSGIISGPAVSGTLLEVAGYWSVWAMPLMLIVGGLVARLLMIERDRDTKHDHASSSDQGENDERSSLLGQSHDQDGGSSNDSDSVPTTTEPEPSNPESTRASNPGTSPPPPPPTRNTFYTLILTDPRVIVSLLNTLLFASIVTSFDSTLPLHLRRIFNWGSLPSGLTFFALQIPGPFLNPVAGMLRDRVGLRYPTTIGWVLVAALLWVLGLPGSGRLGFQSGLGSVNGLKVEKGVFVAAVAAIGCALPLVRGVAMVQIMGIVYEIKERNPGLLGKHGATSKVFSSIEVVFNLGTTLGPIIAGSLMQGVGFYYTGCVLGEPFF